MYKTLQEIKSILQFNIDDSLSVASIKFNTLRLRKLLSAINTFAEEMRRFKALEKNDINNDITSRLKLAYNSMCDAWKSMTSLEISQLSSAVTTQYSNLYKAFAGCGLTALNDVFNNFKLKVVSAFEDIKTQFDSFEKIFKSNERLANISLRNDGKALLNLDVGEIYPLQISCYDVPVIASINAQGDLFKDLGDSFTALFVEEAEDLGIKKLVNEDKSIIEIKSKTESIIQKGLAMLDRLIEQYCSNSAVALSSTKEYCITYREAIYIGQLKDEIPNGVGRYCFHNKDNFVGK